MYCTRCGKEIESGIICDECIDRELEERIAQKRSEQTTYDPASEPEADVEKEPERPAYAVIVKAPSRPENENPMLGFGRALASTIIGVIASIFGFVTNIYAMAGENLAESDPDSALAVLIAVAILSIVFTIPLVIISLVMGARSIGVFTKAVGRKPIATLILGIVGVYHALGAVIMIADILLSLQ